MQEKRRRPFGRDRQHVLVRLPEKARCSRESRIEERAVLVKPEVNSGGVWPGPENTARTMAQFVWKRSGQRRREVSGASLKNHTTMPVSSCSSRPIAASEHIRVNRIVTSTTGDRQPLYINPAFYTQVRDGNHRCREEGGSCMGLRLITLSESE